MIYLKKFYLIPWTVWCGISFLVLNSIGFIFLFIFLSTNNKKLYHWAHHIPTIIGRFSLVLWGIKVEVLGKENYHKNSQYIFVGNHRSMLDALLSAAYILNPKKFIGKAEILKWPFLGFILRKIYIPVKRDNKESRLWSKEQLNLKMKEGYSMVIFVEGATNDTKEILLPFKKGAFEACCSTQTPLVPFVIDQADKLWHRRVLLISPGKIKISFLKPHKPLENNPENIELLKEEVFQKMKEEYIRLNILTN